MMNMLLELDINLLKQPLLVLKHFKGTFIHKFLQILQRKQISFNKDPCVSSTMPKESIVLLIKHPLGCPDLSWMVHIKLKMINTKSIPLMKWELLYKLPLSLRWHDAQKTSMISIGTEFNDIIFDKCLFLQ